MSCVLIHTRWVMYVQANVRIGMVSLKVIVCKLEYLNLHGYGKANTQDMEHYI